MLYCAVVLKEELLAKVAKSDLKKRIHLGHYAVTGTVGQTNAIKGEKQMD